MSIIPDILRCPVCSMPLGVRTGSLKCENGHCFDIASEGYVNLLSGSHRAGSGIGDNREMARSRRSFLESGLYSGLADAVCSLVQGETVLDICCGEGYYTNRITERYPEKQYYGFDISKEMVRLAAKRKCPASFFVANISCIPVRDESVDFAFHLFAPFHPEEFYRIMKKGGTLVTAIPGKRHLFSLKEVLYDTPYENDEKLPDTGRFVLDGIVRAEDRISLDSREKIMSLLKMTPYFYHTPSEGLERLEKLESTETETDFVLAVLKKK